MNNTALTHICSVGWEEDDDTSYFDLGSDSNDGFTLVHVQMFEGRDPTEPLKTRAQGTKLICHINAGQRVPPRDTRCYVLIPAGMEMTPGAGVIVATVEKTLDGRLDADRTVMDYGDQHVVIKGKSVSIQGDDGSFVSVGSPRSGGTAGVIVQASDGSGAVFQPGVSAIFATSGGSAPSMVQVTPTQVDIVNKGGTRCVVNDAGFSFVTAQTIFLAGGTIILGVASGTYTTYKPQVAGASTIVNSNILMASS